MTCFCIGGPNCCIRHSIAPAPEWKTTIIKEVGPTKCPDCGVWWWGLEHKCKKGKASKNV